MIMCITYGKAKMFETRKDAIKFFREGIAECDGCERERYMEVYLDLIEGKQVCWDKQEGWRA